MNFYDKYCLPHLLNCYCGCKDIQGLRADIIPDLINEGHLQIQTLETQYMPFVPKPIGFTFIGSAVKKTLHHY